MPYWYFINNRTVRSDVKCITQHFTRIIVLTVVCTRHISHRLSAHKCLPPAAQTHHVCLDNLLLQNLHLPRPFHQFPADTHTHTPFHSRITYLLTAWCRVLPEKLTGLQLVKKFHAFHGTPRFITAVTSVRHLSLSWASPIHFIYPHPTS